MTAVGVFWFTIFGIGTVYGMVVSTEIWRDWEERLVYISGGSVDAAVTAGFISWQFSPGNIQGMTVVMLTSMLAYLAIAGKEAFQEGIELLKIYTAEKQITGMLFCLMFLSIPVVAFVGSAIACLVMLKVTLKALHVM